MMMHMATRRTPKQISYPTSPVLFRYSNFLHQ